MITESSFVVDAFAQADGRRYVSETHTDHLGQTYTFNYGPVGVVDYAAIAAQRAITLAAELAQQEFEGAINGV